MNRLYHLQETLPKNIKDNYLPDDVEFVLLDYHSSDGLEEWVRSEMQTYIDNGITEPQRRNITIEATAETSLSDWQQETFCVI